ncbi:glycoside hydrolase family 28 protein [Streptomyces sp. HPF1205]|uniref:glycoside hydrolase family 28 protein n=1 Tax=Streptomyces sp. HPF1205 TaxID=2873262 RepID=UPI001CEC2707|nr:glycosyl hydrolase family 28 protein [Streptomyces sp. HPF1205]
MLTFTRSRPKPALRVAITSAALAAGLLPALAHPALAATVCSAKSYGATGNGMTKDTAALQKAITACSNGGVAELTAGSYLTGPLTLPSGITLQIDAGATLLASQNAADYATSGSGLAALLTASKASDVTIDGGGTIDGQGAPWWAEIEAEKAAGKPLSPRPAMISLQSVGTASLTDITVKNAPNAHVTMKQSTNVTIDGMHISSPPTSPNTDGFDIWSSSSVRLTNSTIDCGDDNVAIDSSAGDGPAHDITVSSDTILHGHGLSIGSYTGGGVYNVSVHDDTMTGTSSGIRIKSARGRGGAVHALTYTHLTMTGVATPILITAYYPSIPADGDPAQAVTSTTPDYYGIAISKVTATGATAAGQIIGVPEQPISGLTLTSVNISAKTGVVVRNASVATSSVSITPASGPAWIKQSNATVS